MKKYNFNAGPSMLPREVIEATAAACLDFEGSGLSLMEISHRAKNFQPVVDKAVDLVKELLDVPEGYAVIFLAGGASTEFCRVPYNFLEKKAAYLNTGTWAKKAMKEAKLFGEVVEVASSADDNYTYIPKNFTIPADADYLHVTSNNTIFGTEMRYDLDSLFHMLVGLINKHIDNEFYVFQGLYSLSSCIAFGNVKFSIPDLLFLLHKCMKYVCGWTWVLHRHLKTSFFISTISITAFFSSSPSMFLCTLCTI